VPSWSVTVVQPVETDAGGGGGGGSVGGCGGAARVVTAVWRAVAVAVTGWVSPVGSVEAAGSAGAVEVSAATGSAPLTGMPPGRVSAEAVAEEISQAAAVAATAPPRTTRARVANRCTRSHLVCCPVSSTGDRAFLPYSVGSTGDTAR
jgi:hypothetical protein